MIVRRTGSRRAFTLIEIILVVGASSLVLALCASLLHAMFRLDRSGRAEVREATVGARLARQFRQDVRAALKATPDANRVAETLALSLPDGGSIAYRREGAMLLREATAEGATRAREGYAMDRLGPVRFEIDGPFVRLVLGRTSRASHVPTRPSLAVEARLGKDRTQFEGKRP